MIKVVILDFDDTLCLTEEATFHLENKIAKSMGFSPMERNTHQKNWGTAIREAITQRIPGINVEEFMKRHAQFVAKEFSDGYLDTIPEENLRVLDKLKKTGKKLSIVTSRDINEVKHLLHESHPISKKIEVIYHRDNSEYLKPDPRVFNQALFHFNVTPEECVYVGDAVSDAIAAKGAGMHFIAVLESGLRTKKDFTEQKVDFFANKFTDIIDYILSH